MPYELYFLNDPAKTGGCSTRQDDERGLVIDIVGMTIDKQEAILEIQKRAIQRCKGPTTVIIKDGNRFVKAFRIK